MLKSMLAMSTASPLEDGRSCHSHTTRAFKAPNNLQLDHPNLLSGLDRSHDRTSPLLLTTPRGISSPFTPSRDGLHARLPSLGEIHQSAEEEQEAQVNRLFQMIISEQQQLQQIRNASSQIALNPANDELAITPQRSVSFSSIKGSRNIPRSPSNRISCGSFENNAYSNLNRRPSTSSCKPSSPGRTAVSDLKENGESPLWTFRDEPAFLQAETQMMIRENQMLQKRIKELESQLDDINKGSQTKA